MCNYCHFVLLPHIIDFHFPESILERLADIGAEIREKASLKDRDIPNEFHDGNTASDHFLIFKNVAHYLFIFRSVEYCHL